jgi:hypothetical protein
MRVMTYGSQLVVMISTIKWQKNCYWEVRSSTPVDIPMSAFAENVTVRSSGEIVLALYPSGVVMCSSESLERLNVITFIMDGYCKNIFVEYVFSPVMKYCVLRV